MASHNPEELSANAFERLSVSAQRDPRLCEWGLFSWGDAPPACGGGVGGFQWFESLAQLLEFITDWSPATYMTFDEEAEWLSQRDRLQTIASQWNRDPAGTLEKLNAELKGLLQIDWIGSWNDLKAGNEAFSIRVRNAFAENQSRSAGISGDGAKQSSQISDDAFVAFLAEYGL
jgi:hypothetical protein